MINIVFCAKPHYASGNMISYDNAPLQLRCSKYCALLDFLLLTTCNDIATDLTNPLKVDELIE